MQRADEEKATHLWGPWGVSREAALAATAVLVIADGIVPRSVIAGDPNRTIVPAWKVAAVVGQRGVPPLAAPGRYRRDHDFYHAYHAATRTVEGFEAWIGSG